MALDTSCSRSAETLKALPHPWLGGIALRVRGDDPELVAGARSAAEAGRHVHVLLPRDRSAQASMELAWPSASRLMQSLAEIRFDPRELSNVLFNSQDCH